MAYGMLLLALFLQACPAWLLCRSNCLASCGLATATRHPSHRPGVPLRLLCSGGSHQLRRSAASTALALVPHLPDGGERPRLCCCVVAASGTQHGSQAAAAPLGCWGATAVLGCSSCLLVDTETRLKTHPRIASRLAAIRRCAQLQANVSPSAPVLVGTSCPGSHRTFSPSAF